MCLPFHHSSNKIAVGVYYRTYYHHVRDFYEEQPEELAWCKKKTNNRNKLRSVCKNLLTGLTNLK